MAGSGAGYDLSTTTYSPDGRVFQVEYAQKAVDNSGTALALCCTDGVVLANEKYIVSRLLVPGSTRRTFAVSDGISLGIAGLVADAKELVEIARNEAKNYKSTYDIDIPARVLAERVSMYVHAYTQYGSVRPFGASILIGSFQNGESSLYCIDPSGHVIKYYGVAVGKGRQVGRNEIEKLIDKRSSLTCREALTIATKILMKAHDENDRDVELEISWIGAESGGKHQVVTSEILKEIEVQAKRLIEQEEQQ